MSTKMQRTSIEEAITNAYSSNFSLNIEREEMAFLIGIHVFLKIQKETTISEGTLKDIYSRINTLIFGDESTVERRARNSIARIREQSLISRVGGLDGNPYVLAPLGMAIGQHWEKADRYTKQSLVIYTSQLRVILENIRKNAETGGIVEHWQDTVCIPLQEIIVEIINCIRHRQDGMTRVQEGIKGEITEKLRGDWFEAIVACEEMVKKTGEAITELHTLLMQETDNLISIIEDISEYAQIALQHEALEAAESVQNQLEAIREWANASLEDWSKYYSNVHNFIRVMVRTDPNREASHRLREAISAHSDMSWTLRVMQPEPCWQLREGEFKKIEPSIEITGKVARAEISLAQPVDTSIMNAVVTRVEIELNENGVSSIQPILRDIADKVSLPDLYQIAGELVEIMAIRGQPHPFNGIPWAEVIGSVQVQNLTVVKKSNQSRKGPKHE